MSSPTNPQLAEVVRAGVSDSSAFALGDGIFMSRGISNCYQIATAAATVMINTGSASEIEAHTTRFSQVLDRPVGDIVFTQSHPDHIGGWQAFAGPGTRIFAQASFADVRRYWRELAPYYGRRTQKLWGFLGGRATVPPPDPTPTDSFLDRTSFSRGGRDVELLAAPGGETLDSLIVWLPASRTAFIGNLAGPIFGHVPNLATVRGDKLRSAMEFVHSIDRLRSLDPELLITGHGEPIAGAKEIRDRLTQLRDATQWLHDATVAGMNAGQSVDELMAELVPPAELTLPEGHGTVRWNVKAVYQEYTGCFDYRSTTELYSVPPSRIASDVLELAGGPEALVARAGDRQAAGEPETALHLIDLVTAVHPAHPGALKVSLAAHRALLDRSGRANLSETRWLESEITRLQDALEAADDNV